MDLFSPGVPASLHLPETVARNSCETRASALRNQSVSETSARAVAPRSFRLGEWLVQPSLDRLSRRGEVVQLRPKVMDVLVHLAANAGEVVSKNALIDAVWARQFIADSALSRAVFELREALGDDPHAPRYIETISKRGYRLIAPVEELVEEMPVEKSEQTAESARDCRQRVVQGAAAAALVLVVGIFVTLAGPRPPRLGSSSPSRIAVLPFANLGDPTDDYFAAGLWEEITTRLAKEADLKVVAPASASSYRDRVDLQRAGEELHVSYVLHGTVRWQHRTSAVGHVRVVPQLVRVEDGSVVWAGSFDLPMGDVLGVQAEVASAVRSEVRNALGLKSPRNGGPSGEAGRDRVAKHEPRGTADGTVGATARSRS